jgi:hypothetical protein
MASGEWLIAEELFERADPTFVDALRDCQDADALGAFAARWFADRRPASRQFLLDYLDRPLNAYRHEALVKRLFKLAEKAGDDEVMGRMLVLFDRSLRRREVTRSRFQSRELKSLQEANALAAALQSDGFESVTVHQNWRQRYVVWGRWNEAILRSDAGTTMPRGKPVSTVFLDQSKPNRPQYRSMTVPDWVSVLGLDPLKFRDARSMPPDQRKRLKNRRLFTPTTRQYLRRRSWRYFRRLSRHKPDRYLRGVRVALLLYLDADANSVLSLLDNWGLLHILFHYSPVLEATRTGWHVPEGCSLSELRPAPYREALWKNEPAAVVDLLFEARCRPVRRWAMEMVRQDPQRYESFLPLERLLDLLGIDDTAVVTFAAERLRNAPGLDQVSADRWLKLTAAANPVALGILCELMELHVRPDAVTYSQTVRFAASRPLPLARLGFAWLQAKTPPTGEDYRLLLSLVEAECESLRPQIVRWARGVLSDSPEFQPEWALEYLDSRHSDVRREGWAWFVDDRRLRDNVTLWQRLLETPYDDLRLDLVDQLEARVAGTNESKIERMTLDEGQLRVLWASVLLNVHRGNRTKPCVVRRLLRQLGRNPAQAAELLPILAVALRSVRGPEWRAGLAAVVQWVERVPEVRALLESTFPELRLV